MNRSLKYIRIYKSERGVWHCEIERDGVLRWHSLHTKDEAEAKRKADRYKATDERACALPDRGES